MVLYRRNRVPGGTFFFTVTLADRRSQLLAERVELLRTAFRVTRQERPFETVAMVVLPDHLHAIWTLPAGDDDYPARWRTIKARFTRTVEGSGVALHRNTKGECNLWQRRYWEHAIRDEIDLQRHVDYIHFNPVKHGYVAAVRDWPHSSFHRYVRVGMLPLGWAGDGVDRKEGGYGEQNPGFRCAASRLHSH